MTTFGSSKHVRVSAPAVAASRTNLNASTTTAPRAPLVPPPTRRVELPRIKTGDGGEPSRKPRERHVLGDPAEVANRALPEIYEFDPQDRVPEFPGQRTAVSARGTSVVDAPITTRDYPVLDHLPAEQVVRYLAPKRGRTGSVAVKQLVDKSDASPMPLNKDGSTLRRT